MTPLEALKRNAVGAFAALSLVVVGCGGGTDGKNALIRLTAELPGSNCASGGAAVQSGLDKNANGALDDDEVNAGQTKYLCSGTAGAAGATGATGPAGGTGDAGHSGSNGANGNNGANGAAGDAGVDGLNALTGVSPEAPGTHCPHGGARIDLGLDTNRNGALDTGEITSTRYVCQDSSIDTMHFGDISIHSAADLAQLDGVQILIGDLIFEAPFGTSLVAADLEKVSGQIVCSVGEGPGSGGGGGEDLVGLASLTFPLLTQVGGMYIANQEDLVRVSAPMLETANSLDFESNPKLTALDFPVLRRLSEGLYLYELDAITTLNFPVLTSVEYLVIEDNPLLTTLTFPVLAVTYDGLNVVGNPLLDTCELYRLAKTILFAERGNIEGNGGGACPAADVCREVTVANHTAAKVYQCIVRQDFAANRATCLELGVGGDLYWAESAAEWLALQNAARAGSVRESSYLGYTDQLTEGTFVPVNGFTGFDPTPGDFWAGGEPNDSNGEDFTQVLSDGKVNDINNGNYAGICRVPVP